MLLSKKLLKGIYPKNKNKIKNNLEKKITNFFEFVKNIVKIRENMINNKMYKGLIKKFTIFDK
jgi:hypothetical protein